MFTHDTTLQTVRISLIALAALAIAAFGAFTAVPKFQLSTPASSSAAVTQVVSRASSGDTIACGRGAYVTADMAGDASPSTVYDTMCGSR